MKSFFTFVLSVFIIFLSHNSGKAQDFEVSPAKLLFSAEPGQTQTISLIVRNHSSQKCAFKIEQGDFGVNMEGKKTQLPLRSSNRSIADWLTTSPSFFEIQPNDQVSVNVSVKIPADGVSTRWGFLSVQTVRERTSIDVDKNISTGITISPRIVVYVIQSPKSNTNAKAKIHSLKEITTEKDTLRAFEAMVDNIGDKIAQCKIYLLTTHLGNREEKEFPPIKVEVFPESSQLIKLKLPKNMPKGKYALAAVLDYGSKYSLEGTQIIINYE